MRACVRFFLKDDPRGYPWLLVVAQATSISCFLISTLFSESLVSSCSDYYYPPIYTFGTFSKVTPPGTVNFPWFPGYFASFQAIEAPMDHRLLVTTRDLGHFACEHGQGRPWLPTSWCHGMATMAIGSTDYIPSPIYTFGTFCKVAPPGTMNFPRFTVYVASFQAIEASLKHHWHAMRCRLCVETLQCLQAQQTTHPPLYIHLAHLVK